MLPAGLVACLIAVSPASFAQGMPGMAPGGAVDASPSSQAYRDAMMKMHKDMDVTLSGNADRDFVQGMIPHHQGAIDMAKVELRFGHDPQLRRLAQEVVAAQEKEIGQMRKWLSKHPK